MVKYRLNWRVLETGAMGHGEPIFKTHRGAQQVADAANKHIDGVVHHWVEAVNEEEESEHQTH